MALQRVLLAGGGEVDLDIVSRVIHDFSRNFRPALEGGTTIEKKEIVRRCVGKVIVDREQKAVRCYIRRFPFAGNPADDLIGRLEKAKTAPEKLMPFRNNLVPGTGPRPKKAGFRPAPRDST